jgi:D-alanine-D-alanine ligase
MGGWSAERDVSLMSGKGIVEALESRGHRVTAIDMDRDVAARLAAAKPDISDTSRSADQPPIRTTT